MIATCPIMHPAAIIRGNWDQEPYQIEFLTRAKDFVEGRYEIIDLRRPSEDSDLYPTLESLARFRREDLSRGVAVDVEAAGPHIICIGFSRVSDLGYVCVRFRRRGGRLYWSSFDELCQAVQWCDEVLRAPEIPLVFHNGQSYDVPKQLMEVGFGIAGYWDHPLGGDTMLMQRTALAGMPSGLQATAVLHLGFPIWKTLISEKDEEAEGK